MITLNSKTAETYILTKHPNLAVKKQWETSEMFVFDLYPKRGNPDDVYPDSLYGVRKDTGEILIVNPMMFDLGDSEEE